MGFDLTLAEEALRRKQGVVQDAVQLLLDHPEGQFPADDGAPTPADAEVEVEAEMEVEDSAAVQGLVAMGFSRTLAEEALRRKGDVSDALQLLLDHPKGQLPADDGASSLANSLPHGDLVMGISEALGISDAAVTDRGAIAEEQSLAASAVKIAAAAEYEALQRVKLAIAAVELVPDDEELESDSLHAQWAWARAQQELQGARHAQKLANASVEDDSRDNAEARSLQEEKLQQEEADSRHAQSMEDDGYEDALEEARVGAVAGGVSAAEPGQA